MESKKKAAPKKNYTEAEVEEELGKFDTRIEEAKKTEGEIEIRDIILEKGLFLKNEVGDFTRAEKILREAIEKTGGASKKMEITFEILLMKYAKAPIDIDTVEKDIAKCKEYLE